MKYILFFTFLLMAAGCSQDSMPWTDSSETTPLAEVKTIEKPPLAMSFQEVKHDSKASTLTFIVEHMNGAPIQEGDYQFHWPNYISDSSGTMYEVAETETSYNEMNGYNLSDSQLGLTLSVIPPVSSGNQNLQMQLPLYIVPSIFDEGYPFEIEDSSVSQVETGDLTLRNVEIEDRQVKFEMTDDHPEQNQQNFSYLFTRIQQEENVYPMFSNIEQVNGTFYVELVFAQPLTLPEHFSIERTTVNLPEWRFSFAIPLKPEDE